MTSPNLSIHGDQFVDADGHVVRLRGPNIGGWLLMGNFITGYAANESFMRARVVRVLGEDRAARFFERLLTVFYNEADAAFLAEQGFNAIRVNVNYRHLGSDARSR